MASRVIGFANQDQRRDRRREIVIPATLDDRDIEIHNIGLSGFGAMRAIVRRDKTTWPELDQRAELRFVDYRGRNLFVLVTITHIDPETGYFGGEFVELPGKAFDVIQDLMLHRDLRVARQSAG